MGEVEIVAVCSKCEAEFDDENDVQSCILCDNDFCDDCQTIHSLEVTFNKDNNNEVKDYLTKFKKEILLVERKRIRKLRK